MASRHRFDPELAPYIDALPRLDLGDVAGSRAVLAGMTASLRPYQPPVPLRIEERTLSAQAGSAPVRVRVYEPERTGLARPAILFMHGGGFVLGDLETDHGTAAKTAATIGAVVVSVDYRLAPEHPYPAAVEDCYAAFEWTQAAAAELEIDPDRLAVYGVSAGGALAAAVALMARDRGGPAPAFQFLAIPVLDDRLQTASMRQFTDTPMWNRASAEASWRHYLGDAAGGPATPSYAAPARAADLAGLAPTYLYVCEFDPLRDEGLEYGRRLVEAGVPTELHLYPGTFHGSSMITRAAVSRRIEAEGMAALRRALDPRTVSQAPSGRLGSEQR